MIQIDMPMPEACDVCPFNYDFCWCKAFGDHDNWEKYSDDWNENVCERTTRPEYCPLKEQEVKTYGKLYCISAEAVANDRHKVEQKLYADIAKCLMENGVLIIHSEETIPGSQITYGWKLKGQAVKWE